MEIDLGYVCKLRNGYAFSSKEYKDQGVPVIRIGDIKDGVVSESGAKKIIPREDYNPFLINSGDILIAMSGATTGKFGIYKSKSRAYQNQRVGKFDILSGNVLERNFLFNQIYSLKRDIEKEAYGGAQPNISSKRIEALTISLAPLPEQRAIVSKIEQLFSELDNGISNLKKAQDQLKVYRQAVLKKAFEGGYSDNSEVINGLPRGWKYKTLKELKDFSIYGPRFSSKDYTSNGVAVLRTSDITEYGKVHWINTPKLDLTEEDYEKYKLIKNDLLITRTGSIGTISVFNDLTKAIPGAFLIHYRLVKDVNIWFIFYFLRSRKAQRHFIEHSSGVGRPNLNVPNIEKLQIPIPLIEVQTQIVQEIESRLSVCDKLDSDIKENLEKAEALRQSILKKAFEGKLLSAAELEACRQEPGWEPAEKLLERIKAKDNAY